MLHTLFLMLALATAQAGQAAAPSQSSAATVDAGAQLLSSAMMGDLAGIKKALTAGADVNTLSDSGAPALSLAALHGHVAAVNALAEAGAAVGATDKSGTTALMVAASQGHTAVAQALVARGADVSAKDKDGITVLMAAASSNRLPTMKLPIARGADVNAANSEGTTALMAAAFGGYAEAGAMLLMAGANVNAKDEAGRTPLMAAALSGNRSFALVLLANKADINAEDNGGSNALIYGAANGHLEIVEVVQKAGLRKNTDVALAFAARGCYLPVVRALMTAGAKPTARVQGTPALNLAAGANCEEAVRVLVKAGADVNGADDENGMTALMEAAAWGHVPIVQALLDSGADMEVKNKQGQTAWTLAAVGQHAEVAEIFRKKRESKK